MREGYTVAVVGAGLVGEALISELRRREFPLGELRVLARSSRRSVLAGETFEVGVAEPGAFAGVDVAFFAGTEGEKGAAVLLAQEAISRGAIVIDNGRDFRLQPELLDHPDGRLARAYSSRVRDQKGRRLDLPGGLWLGPQGRGGAGE